ncbi:MAG: ribonuclease H-like domain-containing protein, partial [Dehalococcoidia bacterium]
MVRTIMIGFPDAYLDIETTGLYSGNCSITVIGIYFCNEYEDMLVQLYNENLTRRRLLEVLEGSDYLYTYNGERFDLPFIHHRLGPDLSRMYLHSDLMHRCHRHMLKGGLKVVLNRLGISRETEGLTGWHAVWLWKKYCAFNDHKSLDLLLRYNRDDVVNLRDLREKLDLLDRAA